MPIFVSRFSPERSLIGSFVAPGSCRNETPERSASETQVSEASSGSTSQGADRVELTRGGRSPDLASPVSTETASTRSAPAAVSDPSTESTIESTSSSIGSLTLLDQLRLRSTSNTPLQNDPVDSPEPPPSVGVENRLGPLAERLRALTQELTANRVDAPAEPPVSAPFDDLISENQTANNAAAVENLDNLIVALQAESDTGAFEPFEDAPVPAIDTQAISEAIVQQDEEVVARGAQEQTLREGLQTIASGLRADAAIETRQNVEATARNTQAAARVQGRREVQQNQRDIQSLQSERRSAQQELRSADQAIRQLQSRNTQIQSGSNQQATPGTSLDIVAQ